MEKCLLLMANVTQDRQDEAEEACCWLWKGRHLGTKECGVAPRSWANHRPTARPMRDFSPTTARTEFCRQPGRPEAGELSSEFPRVFFSEETGLGDLALASKICVNFRSIKLLSSKCVGFLKVPKCMIICMMENRKQTPKLYIYNYWE